MVVGNRLRLCRRFGLFDNVSFLSYFVTLTPYVNCFVELPATLVSEFGCHVFIHFKRVGLDIYIYT